MKISLKWLNTYIDIEDYFSQPAELGKILTAAGLEVEGMEDLSLPYRHVVVGHLLSVERHPNADRLTVCQVSTGGGVVHQIVCGATNHKTGDKVAAALAGAVLPGDFAIKKSKIRDVESSGMLCSEVELALKKESAGILILPEDAPVGEEFSQYWGMNDIVLELNVTPNRADCLSHLGVARELSTLTGRPLHWPELNIHRGGKATSEQVKIEVKDQEKCPRYTACVVRNVKVGPSPQWLSQRLERMGMNSINNVVDITNFILLDLGQPLHAFDLDQLHGGVLSIRGAQEQETFVTLDGTELKLSAEDLTIRDGERAVCVAGVIGGKNSAVTEQTVNILLESANFKAESVRKTSRRLGVDTDSSYRFSRGVNIESTKYALDRACQLLQDLAGGEVAQDSTDIYASQESVSAISLDANFVSSCLGFTVTAEQVSQILKSVGCKVEEKDSGLLVTPPVFRSDITMAMDLVEECARVIGYDKIPEKIPVLREAPSPHSSRFRFDQSIKDFLVHQGLCEAVNYGFVSEQNQKATLGNAESLKALGLNGSPEAVPILNPLTEELNVMRQSLLPGLLKNLAHNSRRGVKWGSLFEVGPVVLKHQGEYQEENRLAVLQWGTEPNMWKTFDKVPLVLRLKGLIENLFHHLKSRSFAFRPLKGAEVPPFLHPGQTAGLFYEGRFVGYMGLLHPSISEELKVREEVAICELNLKELEKGQPRIHKFASVSQFLGVERDLAFMMPKSMNVADVIPVIKKAAGNTCQEVQVFDVFEGGSLPADQRSVAFRMTFHSAQKTLEDAELNQAQENIIQKVKDQLGLSLR